MSKINLTVNALVASVLAGNVRVAARTPAEVERVNATLAGAVTAILLLAAAGVWWSWKRTGLSFRDWWDSLR